MLTELQLSNFKSWRELDMKLGRVTGLFGTNSSGKSSILQFLLMLKQTKNAIDKGLSLELDGGLVNLGSFKDLIYRHEENLELDWTINWKNNLSFIIENKALVSLNQQQIKTKFIGYKFKETTIDMKENGSNFQLFQNNKLIGEIPKPIKVYSFPYEAKKYYGESPELNLYSIEIEYERLMDSIFYLGPLREFPKKFYQWSGSNPSDVGIRGERTVEAILSATIRNQKTIVNYQSVSFQEAIAYWLKELKLIQDFSIREIGEQSNLYRAIVKKDKESPEAFLTDVGFGVSQVLPALVLLYYVPEGSIILMEQPEIHLHPSVQSGLADVILQVSKQRNLQVIVESHSEHLLRRFQRRIAEEQYPADELKLYFCDSQQGESKLIDLKINEYGEIENWPENFFGDEMAEIAATRRAGLIRKIRNEEQHGG